MTIFLLLATVGTAQDFENFPEFGNFSVQDAALKQVDFEKDANAVILHHLARSDYSQEYNLVTLHRIKLKILNEKGLDEANIVIPYYSKDNYEHLTGIEAVIRTYDDNGQFATQTLDKKSIFNKKINEFYSETRFTLPNVKVGSIIEYAYYSNMKSYGGLDSWEFQSNLPTLISYYKLAIVPNAEFAYKVYKLPELPIQIDNKTAGWVSFKMQQVPALHNEAYMDSRRDNLQRVTFQLSAFNSSGYKQKYVNSWDEAARELLSTPELGGQLNKSLSGTDQFLKETKLIADPWEKLKAVYQYVQSRISWNGYDSKYTVDGIKKAWEKGTGTNGEINLILVNLLNEVGIEACPLLANDRNRGKIDINYPFLDQFRKLVSYVTIDGRKLIVDASDTRTPLRMMPYGLLNTWGYIVDKKKKGLVLLEDNKSYYDNRIIIQGEVSQDGVFNGRVTDQSRTYARLERKEQYQKMEPSKYLDKYFRENLTDLKPDSLVVDNLDYDSLPFVQRFVFKQTLNTSGEYTFLNYHMFTGLGTNPFTNKIRFSDINFGSPQRYVVSQLIMLPENYDVDAIPKNISMITPDTAFRLSRAIRREGQELSVMFMLDINRSYFEREDYETLQAFYKKMYSILNEQIVLKRKS